MAEEQPRLDVYALRARTYPALLTVLPIGVGATLWGPTVLVRLWPIVVAAGGLFLMSNLARSRGKRLEQRLTEKWDGLPTTHMLRHAEVNNRVLFERRRDALERLIGQALPTKRQEQRNKQAADEAYVAATRILISRVRERQKRYPRVHEENINYGFRRNLRALKPIALVILGALVVLAIVAFYVAASPLALIVGGLYVLAAICWIALITTTWVREAGTSYAERLFEALEDPALFEASSAPGTDT